MDITFSENGFEPYSREFTVSADTAIMVQLKPEKWIKSHEKEDSGLHTKIEEKKTSGRKRFWFF
jgi:hypothetical protein